MNIKEIESLIKFVSKSGVSEVELETTDIKITIKTPDANKPNGDMPQVVHAMPSMPQYSAPPQAAPAPAEAPAPKAAEKPAAPAKDDNLITVKSPMIGTFYRSPDPEKPSFVNVGDTVSVGDTVCIIEAMKLFNEIESEVSGRIVKVLVDDNSPVEYDQPLFMVEPA